MLRRNCGSRFGCLLWDPKTLLTYLNQTWGEAYKMDTTSPAYYEFKTFTSSEHDLPMDGYQFQHNHYHTFNQISIPRIELPNASEHPFFYLGIYASIGLASALVSVLSVIAQYTGALRASRILFK